MPDVTAPSAIAESGDVDHDQTEGGTEGNPHADSAGNADTSDIQSSSDVDHNSTSGGTGGTPHDHANPSDVSSIQSSSDVDHNNTSGGTSGNPHSGSASTNHGNGSHSSTFETTSGAQQRVDDHAGDTNAHHTPPETPLTFIGSQSQTDETTGASAVVDNISGYNAYRVYVSGENFNSGTCRFLMNLNGDSTDNYDFASIAGGTLTETVDNDHWALFEDKSETADGGGAWVGNLYELSSGVAIRGGGASSGFSIASLITGRLNKSLSINSIEVDGSAFADFTVELSVYGMDNYIR